MNILNQRLKEYRIYQNLTQKELSELSGISLLTINKIERGQDSRCSTFEALFAALGYPNIFNNILPSIEERPSVKINKQKNLEIKRVRKQKKKNDWTWGE